MNTRNQKRQLEDPGDISVTRAPQAPKKTKKKSPAGGAGSATATSNSILPTSISNPTPKDVALLPAADIMENTSKKATMAPKRKTTKKKQDKPGTVATTMAETPQEPHENTVSELAPAGNTQTTSKRKVVPSLKAQEVALQDAAEKEKKAASTKKKAKKAASAVINETPDATRAFLECMKASSASMPENTTTSRPSDSAATSPTSTTATNNTTSGNNGPIPNKRRALNLLLQAHQAPASSSASVISTASSFSSLTPSESVSQGEPAASTPKPLPRPKPKPKPKGKATTSSLLSVPESTAPSRDVSPLPEQLADGDIAEYSGQVSIDPKTILDGISNDLAPVLQMPNPLPGPLYVPERKVPLEPIDLDAFPAAERPKLRARRLLKVKDLKPIDQNVVKSALSRMGALLVAVCGFPDEDTAWLLACNANHWASKKHGRHLKLSRGSEYSKLLYDRIPQMRACLVTGKSNTKVALTYKLESADSPTAIEGNRNKVDHLLDDLNFTLQSPDSPGGLYENHIFQGVMQIGLFSSAEAIGVVHNDLFRTISLPCMALAAAAVEKVLMSFKSGVQVDTQFNANNFAPIYLSHLYTLSMIYNAPEAQAQLTNHLRSTAESLRKPFLGALRSEALKQVQMRVPRSLITERYRPQGSTDSTDGSQSVFLILLCLIVYADHKRGVELVVKKRLSAPSQELALQLKMKVGAALRSVSASSTPESDVMNAIFASAKASRDTPGEDFTAMLAQVAGSSDSEVQAARSGALKPNMAENAMMEPPGSDDSDSDTTENPKGSTPPVSQGAGGSSVASSGRSKPARVSTLSDPDSEMDSSDKESNGEGEGGLLGDVSMRTVGQDSGLDEDEDEGEGEAEDEAGDEGEGEGEDEDEDEDEGESEDEDEGEGE